MKHILKNDRNQVRWGYKLMSFVLIQEIFVPIAILLVSVALVNSAVSGFTGVRGVGRRRRAAGGVSRGFPERLVYRGDDRTEPVDVPVFLGAWKYLLHGSARSMGLAGREWLKQLGVGFAIGVVMITIVCGGIYLTGSARVMNGSGLHFSPWLAGYLLVFVFVGLERRSRSAVMPWERCGRRKRTGLWCFYPPCCSGLPTVPMPISA